MKTRSLLALSIVLSSVSPIAAAAAAHGPDADTALAAAKAFVEKSDRYLHHDRVRRGMKGHGLTVLVGTKPVKFGIEVVSVMDAWGPGQSAILITMSGHGLEKTGVISGMSGSPVFVRDGRDGKSKMIGAVAFGWSAPKTTLCGVQPITQMLAVHGARSQKLPPEIALLGAPVAAGMASEAYLKTMLDPRKVDFSILPSVRRAAGRSAKASRSGGPGLVPLATPLMVSGIRSKDLAALSKQFRPLGIVPVQAGSVGAADRAKANLARIEPGGSLAIPLATGDADWSAVGTVTEVIGNRVLALGHSFFSSGRADLPMSTAYVHTVVSGMMSAFKLSTSVKTSGALYRDTEVAVAGDLRKTARMIPMTVAVTWPDVGRTQKYRYRICHHDYLTSSMISAMIRTSSTGWRDMPEYHTVRYSTDVEFAKLGKFHSENVSSGNGVMWAISDTSRPVSALLNNPYGPPPTVKSIDVKIRIERGDTMAVIQRFRLDGNVFRPGETITGHLLVRRFRRRLEKLPITFKLPADLPEGSYSLSAVDFLDEVSAQLSENPHRHTPQNTGEMLAAMQRVMVPQSSLVYLRMHVPRGSGLALGTRELPDLPPSRARMIVEARKLYTFNFTRPLVQTVKTKYVVSGSAGASFTVRDKPAETLLREKGK